MSTIQGSNIWPSLSKQGPDKYEKCRNITEEIYKRINITFEIKKLEMATQSDVSEQGEEIDSNDLSNGTDLFACDNTDSIPSSTEAEQPATCVKYVNINNNEEKTKKAVATPANKRPKKRFRKRIKKHQSKSKRSDTDGSSDEAPLSRIVDIEPKCIVDKSESTGNVMGVPKIIIVTKDLKPMILSPDKKHKHAESITKHKSKTKTNKEIKSKDKEEIVIDKKNEDDLSMDRRESVLDWKKCSVCDLPFRGEKGLRRHMTISHLAPTLAQSLQRSHDARK